MAYRAEVRYIEAMKPHLVDMAAEDFKRVVRLIESALPTLERVKRGTRWAGTGKELFDRRLKEADLMMEALRDGYRKAGRALDDYVDAQTEAQRLVGEGVRVESALGSLIGQIGDPGPEPMKGWEHLRARHAEFARAGETGIAEQIRQMQPEADRLFNQAGDLYQRAIRTETAARGLAGAALGAARGNLPDFLANSGDARAVIGAVSGLQQEIYQAATDPNARRPGAAVMAEYQVVEDPNRDKFPDPPLSWVVDPRQLTASEAEILRELQQTRGVLGLQKFKDIHDEAFAVADARFASPDRNDDHNDAFRHAYWNARLTQEFGEEWTTRYTTAHETIPGNQAAREAMDLYNNEVGRAVALANPGVSPEVLADRVQEAVQQGRTVVIGRDGKLDYSDQLTIPDTGQPANTTLPGHPQPQKKTGS
ncbi:hypothetical protein ABGB07_16235 [Micromonosporaceae bacterium B7E4]